jgi:UDP-glucose:O-linked fucose beta-1,3-glucosyltransferase
MLSKVTSDLAGKRSELNQLKELVQQRETRAGQLEKEAAASKAKLNSAEKNTMTAEERTAQLEAMLEEEQRDQKALERDLVAAREQQYRATQQAHNLREQQQLVEQAIVAHHAANRNTTSRMRALETELAQQERMQYQQDFQITQLQRKFDRLEGKRSKEEEDVFQAQLAELREELEQQKKTRTLLQRQLTRVTDSLRLQRRRLDDAVMDHQRWDDKLQQLQLSNRNAEQELKDVIAQRQELIVEENVLKLEIRRVRGALNERADKVGTVFSVVWGGGNKCLC